MDSSLLISASEFRFRAQVRYPNAAVYILDRDYNIPTEDAVAVYMRELAAELFAAYGDKWQEYFDCDNFGIEALRLAYRKHWIARQANRGNAQGVSIAFLCFDIVPVDLTTGHVINSRLLEDKSFSEFDPQNRLRYPLTSAQCASASLFFCC